MTLEQIVEKIRTEVINPLISFLFVAATAVFVWGVIEYLWGSENEEARSKGRRHMFWGIVGLLIMFATGAIMQVFCFFFYNTRCP